MKRALLLFNPKATNVSSRVRDVIAHALASELKLDVVGTEQRHHATELARSAADDGFELLVCLGGDGTLNEVVNGLAGSDVAVVPLPGGGTNVFARAIGLPRDPVEATSVVLDQIVTDAPTKRFPLGEVNGRCFVSSVGVGFDAAVVRSVERAPGLRRRLGETAFVLEAVRLFYLGYDRSSAPLTVWTSDRTIGGIRQLVICASHPYTFFGRRQFRLAPLPDGEHLAGVALGSLGTITTLRTLFRAFGRARHDRLRSVHFLPQLTDVRALAVRPLPYQVDGDHAGEASEFEISLRSGALSVLGAVPG